MKIGDPKESYHRKQFEIHLNKLAEEFRKCYDPIIEKYYEEISIDENI